MRPAKDGHETFLARSCYIWQGMTVRGVLVLLAVIVAVLAPSLALAVHNCAGMSTDCEGPCGTATPALVPLTSAPGLDLAADDVPGVPLHLMLTPVRLLDVPPRRLSA